ncbi:MAG: hypothetical protein NVS4B3_00860 [Gemmatimonadaceae bacterium]
MTAFLKYTAPRSADQAEHGAHRGRVEPLDPLRKRDKVIRTRRHEPQIKVLEDVAPPAEKGAMYGQADTIPRVYRWRVNADEKYASLDEPLRHGDGQDGPVGGEHTLCDSPPRSQQESRIRIRESTVDRLCRERPAVGEIQDNDRSNKSVEREGFAGRPSVSNVKRRIGVRSDVRTRRNH